jgi:hypothetical protein
VLWGSAVTSVLKISSIFDDIYFKDLSQEIA